MVFKRLQDSQDSLYLQAMQLYQSSFPLLSLIHISEPTRP